MPHFRKPVTLTSTNQTVSHLKVHTVSCLKKQSRHRSGSDGQINISDEEKNNLQALSQTRCDLEMRKPRRKTGVGCLCDVSTDLDAAKDISKHKKTVRFADMDDQRPRSATFSEQMKPTRKPVRCKTVPQRRTGLVVESVNHEEMLEGMKEKARREQLSGYHLF